MSDVTTTSTAIKEFLVDEFLSPEDAEELDSETELYATGILDSMGTLKLVTFLEGEFGVSLEPNEVTQEQLASIRLIADLVDSKS